MIEVPLPTRPIIARAIFHDASPVEDAFDPSANARCSLGLVLPDRSQHLQNQRIVNCGNRLVLEDRLDRDLKRCLPLVGVFASFQPALWLVM